MLAAGGGEFLGEPGLPQFGITVWFGLSGPRHLPPLSR